MFKVDVWEDRNTATEPVSYLCGPGKVIAPARVKVRQNQPVTIYCKLELEQGETLKQILWRNNHNQTLFVYHPDELPNITDNQRVTLESPTLHTTAVTIEKVSLEDKDCYVCVFYVYPGGSQERSICLEIMGEFHQRHLGYYTKQEPYLCGLNDNLCPQSPAFKYFVIIFTP